MDAHGFASSNIDPRDAALFMRMEHESFRFRHELGRSGLFGLEALRTLATYMQQNNLDAHFESGANRVDKGWGDHPKDVRLTGAFDMLPTENTLIILKSVHRHPAYQEVLNQVLAEVGDISGIDMGARYCTPICTIIIASPRRVTPYHMDDAHNLLFQVHGAKTFYVFDGSDPAIVSDIERERFWTGDQNAALHTPERQARALRCDLRPGDGVHVPVTYPHWAQNGDEVSIAVSMNFRSARNRDANIYKLNRYLRRAGLRPKAPGRNHAVDAVKALAVQSLFALRNTAAKPEL